MRGEMFDLPERDNDDLGRCFCGSIFLFFPLRATSPLSNSNISFPITPTVKKFWFLVHSEEILVFGPQMGFLKIVFFPSSRIAYFHLAWSSCSLLLLCSRTIGASSLPPPLRESAKIPDGSAADFLSSPERDTAPERDLRQSRLTEHFFGTTPEEEDHSVEPSPVSARTSMGSSFVEGAAGREDGSRVVPDGVPVLDERRIAQFVAKLQAAKMNHEHQSSTATDVDMMESLLTPQAFYPLVSISHHTQGIKFIHRG